ncbi:MAG: ATP-binding protein, partial [Actinocrinis sp.]
MFRQRANAARPGVELPEDVLRELCARLDGLPLAVELAAARVRVMSVAEIARRLDDRFALLRGAARDAPERHRTLRAVIDWSWNLLEADGQAAMRALSVFPGGFTADAAQHLLGADDVDALETLAQLVDQSLLQAADTGSGTRFRMLETVREFSAARRREAGEGEDVVGRFLAWARDFGLAHHESMFGPDLVTSAGHTRDEQENLLLALRLGLEREDGASVAATFAVLGGLRMFESDFARMAELTGRSAWLLSHLRPQPAHVEVARTATGLAAVSALILQHPAARVLVGLRRLPPAPPDTPARAIAVVLGTLADAREDQLASLNLLCESDQPLLAAIANTVAAFVWQSVNDPDSALKAARRTLAAFAGLDRQLPWFQVMTHSRIGELYLELGRGDEAHEHFAATLSILDELPGLNAFENGSSAARVRNAMVLANLQRNAVDEAEYWLDLTLREDGDMGAGLPMLAVAARASIRLARGEVEDGLRLWRQAAEALLDPRNQALGGELHHVLTWTREVEAMAVIAHAQHDRLALVGRLAGKLPRIATGLIADIVEGSSASYTDFPLVGTQLLALAMLDL